MDQIKPITIEEFNVLSAKLGYNLEMIIKDYYLTLLLFYISNVKGIYFKGGTALNNMFLNHVRLSEDLDFTVTSDLRQKEKEIKEIILKTKEFNKVEHDVRVRFFVRLIAHYKKEGVEGSIIIDLNKRAKIRLKPINAEFKHFYPEFIPKFKVNTLDIKELVAGKMCATVNRNAPRDYYDIYNIIKNNLPLDMKLIKQKFKDCGEEYDINKIFRRADKIYNRWNSDLLPLTTTKPTFKEVMQTLTEFFKYKEHKEKEKNKSKKVKQC